ncbi:MAG: hypothetical protein HYX68_14120 [Planctomycetes bacterium]|nr:hypothetical protein [Planctomycetota bacterium]
MRHTKQTKAFMVASVSENLNSFGLTGMILMAGDGEAWEVGASSLYVKAKGEIIHVPVVGKTGRNFASLAFEIPTRLPDAPAGVVDEVWSYTSDSGRE